MMLPTLHLCHQSVHMNVNIKIWTSLCWALYLGSLQMLPTATARAPTAIDWYLVCGTSSCWSISAALTHCRLWQVTDVDQRDRQTSTWPLRRTCSAYYVGIVSKVVRHGGAKVEGQLCTLCKRRGRGAWAYKEPPHNLLQNCISALYSYTYGIYRTSSS